MSMGALLPDGYLGPDCAPDPTDPASKFTTTLQAGRYNIAIVHLQDPR
jgi:hypothetical protein